MKVRDIIKLIEADGWYQVDTTGRVTIASHPGDDLAPGTLNSVLKQAKLKEAK
ncbi:MAG: type II toxin-antitoxin system HicA family toxin [Candidatus Brocadia sp.]|jgi:predicted RNA binding protein YcfA (HicA-like mRNA interferase family)